MTTSPGAQGDPSNGPGEPRSDRWSDLGRPPLNSASLRRALVREGGLWSSLDVVPVIDSTNTDLAGRADRLPEGAVLVAEEQKAGRGRLDRTWSAPARSGLFFSVLLKPGEVPVHHWGWLPLLTGVAVATGLSRAAGVDTALKWPNDLLLTVGGEERKAAASSRSGRERRVWSSESASTSACGRTSCRCRRPGRWRSPVP